MERSPAIEARLAALHDTAIASMRCVHDEATINLELQKGSDVAGVRGHVSTDDAPAPQVAPAAGAGGPGGGSGDGGGSSGASAHDASTAGALFEAAGPEGGAPVGDTTPDESWTSSHLFVPDSDETRALRAVQAAFKGGSQSEPPATAAAPAVRPIVARITSPAINEFVENDALLACSFPTLFVLGACGLDAKLALSSAFRRYLMRFADNRFAEDFVLMHFLFDQARRMDTCRAVKAKVHGDAPALKRLADLSTGPSFVPQLDAAIQDPTNPKYKSLIDTVMASVHAISPKLPYSVEARQATRRHLTAFRQFYGKVCFFVTISPGDTCSPLVMRLCSEVENPYDPPLLDTTITVPTFDERVRKVCKNPVAAAEFFGAMVHSVFSDLVGLAPVHTIKKVDVEALDRHAMLGSPLAYVGVDEVTGRDALHCHFLAWVSGLTPEVLQLAVDNHHLHDRIRAVVESQTQVWLPQSVHMWKGLDQHARVVSSCDSEAAPPTSASMGTSAPEGMLDYWAPSSVMPCASGASDSAIDSTQALLFSAPARDDSSIARLPIQYISPGLPMANNVQSYQRYLTDMFRVARCLQVHQHTFTCWREGLATCRLAYGRMSWNAASGPLQLDVSVRPPKPFAAIRPPAAVDSNDESANPWYPFPAVDTRVITYQQFRPVFGIVEPQPLALAEDGVHLAIPPVSANSRVVSFIPALTFVTRANNASYRLYSNSESAGAMAYMGT